MDHGQLYPAQAIPTPPLFGSISIITDFSGTDIAQEEEK